MESRSVVVVKVGSSSVTSDDGGVNHDAIVKLASEVVETRSLGHDVVVVTSGAIAVGMPALVRSLSESGGSVDRVEGALRAASAIGQTTLMEAFQAAFATHGLLAGQVLLAPTDLMFRHRYLKSRGTLRALLDFGAVPIINENDAIADDEIRFGDNDRLAALVAHLIEATHLVLLTDTDGLFTADPRVDETASLIEEIVAIDAELEAVAGGARSAQSRGGMASKLAAAKIATWSGVETVIARAERDGVLPNAVAGAAGFGTRFRARTTRLAARKLWIAFALPSSGRVVVDGGARQALTERGKSLLPAGVVSVEGEFGPDDAVEVVDETGSVFAKGQVRWSSRQLIEYAGKHTSDLPAELGAAVIHRDALVVLP